MEEQRDDSEATAPARLGGRGRGRAWAKKSRVKAREMRRREDGMVAQSR